jgi:hypothetical protein
MCLRVAVQHGNRLSNERVQNIAQGEKMKREIKAALWEQREKDVGHG